jgi:hypothetical protein
VIRSNNPSSSGARLKDINPAAGIRGALSLFFTQELNTNAVSATPKEASIPLRIIIIILFIDYPLFLFVEIKKLAAVVVRLLVGKGELQIYFRITVEIPKASLR